MATKSTNQWGAFVTSRPSAAAKWLNNKKIVITQLGGNLYSFVCLPEEGPMELLARIKGRGSKPFVRMTSPQYRTLTLKTPGVSQNLATEARRAVASFFDYCADRAHPVTLLPTDETAYVPNRLKGTLGVNGTSINTVGFMLSGPHQGYVSLVSHFSKYNYYLAATSANISDDPNCRGSGHSRLVGLVRDFGLHSDVCFYIPNDLKEGEGTSSSLVYIHDDGKLAIVVRVGEINLETMRDVLTKAGITEIRHDITKNVLPYDYTNFEYGRGTCLVLHNYLRLLSRATDFHITSRLLRLFGVPMISQVVSSENLP